MDMSNYRNYIINSPAASGNDKNSFPYMESYLRNYMYSRTMDLSNSEEIPAPPLSDSMIPGSGDLPSIPAMPTIPEPGNSGGNHTPVIPMPDSGEGTPAFPGSSADNIPVIPLPNPGEGDPAFPGPSQDDIPVIPLPNPGEGGPAFPGPSQDDIPMIPLPNPGEGGPAFPGPSDGTIITVYPRPIIPCYFCNANDNRFGSVRFLNTAFDYNPFFIYINNQLVVSSLSYAEISQYGRVSTGQQNISVAGANGYVFIQKSIFISSGSTLTIAITNTTTGLDLTVISDVPCSTPANLSCFRASNLSPNSGPLDVTLNNNYVVFSRVSYQDVTAFRRVQPGGYLFHIRNSRSGQNLVSPFITIRPNTIYTLYIFNWNSAPDAIRTLVVEDRK